MAVHVVEVFPANEELPEAGADRHLPPLSPTQGELRRVPGHDGRINRLRLRPLSGAYRRGWEWAQAHKKGLP